jgi:Holliday junction resolvase-like predicted endonuclease
MATGLTSKLTGQIGEHLVTAELGRRGIIATPFSGNVPDIDILAHASGVTSHIQVKAINKDSWQFDIRKFLDVNLTERGQIVRGANRDLDRKIICVFVSLGAELGEDKFYIFKQGWLQDYFAEQYKGRTPPKNINSFHCAIWERDMGRHLGKWQIITNKFKV